MKKGIRMGDLLFRTPLKINWPIYLNGKILPLGTAREVSLEAMTQWLMEFGKPLLGYITDTMGYLLDAVDQNKNILFEAQLGALRDIDYGIYPYTTSSQTLAAYAPIGAGVPGVKLDRVVGVMKAYSSCVGKARLRRAVRRGSGYAS